MRKTDRHSKIIDFITQKRIETQDELAAELIVSGHSVTQATVSRDIKELGLVKISDEGGRQYYTKAKDLKTLGCRLSEILRDVILSVTLIDKMVIIKTVDGFGRAAKSAFFDVAECMGCVADNDTVFIVFKDGEVAAAFHKKIGFLRS